MKKKIVFIMFIIHMLLLLIFYRGTLSVVVPIDKWFYLIYIDVCFVTAIIVTLIKKKRALYIVGSINCVLVFGLLLGYYLFGRTGYTINIKDVNLIEYIQYGDFTLEVNINENEKVIKAILCEYNEATCIKRWDEGGQVCTPNHNVIIHLNDDSRVVIYEDGMVSRTNKLYKSTLNYDRIVAYINNN